jgi:hypothetical protein
VGGLKGSIDVEENDVSRCPHDGMEQLKWIPDLETYLNHPFNEYGVANVGAGPASCIPMPAAMLLA